MLWFTWFVQAQIWLHSLVAPHWVSMQVNVILSSCHVHDHLGFQAYLFVQQISRNKNLGLFLQTLGLGGWAWKSLKMRWTSDLDVGTCPEGMLPAGSMLQRDHLAVEQLRSWMHAEITRWPSSWSLFFLEKWNFCLISPTWASLPVDVSFSEHHARFILPQNDHFEWTWRPFHLAEKCQLASGGDRFIGQLSMPAQWNNNFIFQKNGL